jgi:DNA repair protein RadC
MSERAQSPSVPLLRDLPVGERPRERLARLGATALSDQELVAILLGSGTRGSSALARARGLLCERGGVPGLERLSMAELRLEKGIGAARASTIVAAFELGRRLAAAPLRERDLLNQPERVIAYLRRQYGHLSQERTGALYLDARNRLVRDAECFRGTLDRAMAEPREIFKTALLENAAAVIVYHNHPSGDPTPSREDREFTKRLAAAAEIVGVRLLDHVVVGGQGGVSFREMGML